MVFQEGFRAELPGTGHGVLFGMKTLVVPIDLSSVHFQLDFLHSDHYSDYCSDFHLTSVFLHLPVVFLLAYLQPGNSQVEWVDHPTLFQKIPRSL